MKPRIAIGITTYKDIKSPEFGRAVFEAYASASPKMTPNQVKVWGKKHAVTGCDDFAALWLTHTPCEVRDSRSSSAGVLERGTWEIGAEWRTGAPVGHGKVDFRPSLDPSRTNAITISHAYSPLFDWLRLFESLVRHSEPAYAMLHLFTEREIAASSSADRFERFDSAFSGEHWFTSFRSPLGHWDVVDNLRLEQRRNYKFLPELSWANVLGPEFDGNYDPSVIAQRAAWHQSVDGRLHFRITHSLQDVIDRFDQFNLARIRLRAAFPPRSFHRVNLGLVSE